VDWKIPQGDSIILKDLPAEGDRSPIAHQGPDSRGEAAVPVVGQIIGPGVVGKSAEDVLPVT